MSMRLALLTAVLLCVASVVVTFPSVTAADSAYRPTPLAAYSPDGTSGAQAHPLLGPLATGNTTGTVQLRVAIPWSGVPVLPCPSGLPATVGCYAHPGAPVVVQGLGFVNQAYIYPVDMQPAGCPAGMFKIRPYTARLTVRDKGELTLALGGVDSCLEGPPVDSVLSPTQAFTVSGGTGVFAGASGTGQVSRTDIRREISGHGAGTDVWEGSITAPNLELDVMPPTITGAGPIVLRAPRKAAWVRVRYRLAAIDDVDGLVAVACKPRSGSRFKVGRRTLVRCSAADTSANTMSVSFTVTIRPRR